MQPEQAVTFERWSERFFATMLRWQPGLATALGDHRFDGDLPDYSVDADRDRQHAAEALIAALDAIPPEGLAPGQQIDRILARTALDLERWQIGAAFYQSGNPSWHIQEAILALVAVVRSADLPPAERIERLTARLGGVPGALATARRRVTRAPLVWTERAIRETEAAAEFLRQDAPALGEGLPGDAALVRAAVVAADALDEHSRWLRQELASRTIPVPPADGTAFEQVLRLGYLAPATQTAEWWFEYAHAELVEATAELHDLARALDWRRSWRQHLTVLEDDHPAAETYLATVETIWDRCRQIAIAADLVSWPDDPVIFTPMPSWERRLGAAFDLGAYRGTPPFGGQIAAQAVVPWWSPDATADEQTRLLRQMHTTRIALDLVVRRTGLGQHVQHLAARGSVSRIGRVAGVAFGSRTALACGRAAVDGWMAYASELMEEVGALTPVQRLFEAHQRVRLAARALADAAIHSGEFALERAARMFRDEVGMPASAALAEAVRISMEPGSGVAALIGVAAIDELRRAEEDRQGASFALRSFHDRVLAYGAIPPVLTAAAMAEPHPSTDSSGLFSDSA